MRERASRQRTLHFIADPEKLRVEQVVQFEQEDRSEAPVFAHGDHDEGSGGWSRGERHVPMWVRPPLQAERTSQPS